MVTVKQHFSQISGWPAEVFGVAVDTPEESAKMRKELELPFEILCDTKKSVITGWNILNKKERGGIAFPNVYILKKGREIIFHSKDRLATRTNLDSILQFIEQYSKDESHRMVNESRSIHKLTFKDMLLGYPRKWKWTK